MNTDAGVLRGIIEEMKRKGSQFGDFVIINKHGKILEIASKELEDDKYMKIIKGKL